MKLIDAYLIDLGILTDKQKYPQYAEVYDGQYGYYDEDQYYSHQKMKSIIEAKEYVENGANNTYAIISKTAVPWNFDFNTSDVEGETYALDNVIYSVAKIDGKVIENFLLKKDYKTDKKANEKYWSEIDSIIRRMIYDIADLSDNKPDTNNLKELKADEIIMDIKKRVIDFLEENGSEFPYISENSKTAYLTHI